MQRVLLSSLLFVFLISDRCSAVEGDYFHQDVEGILDVYPSGDVVSEQGIEKKPGGCFSWFSCCWGKKTPPLEKQPLLKGTPKVGTGGQTDLLSSYQRQPPQFVFPSVGSQLFGSQFLSPRSQPDWVGLQEKILRQEQELGLLRQELQLQKTQHAEELLRMREEIASSLHKKKEEDLVEEESRVGNIVGVGSSVVLDRLSAVEQQLRSLEGQITSGGRASDIEGVNSALSELRGMFETLRSIQGEGSEHIKELEGQMGEVSRKFTEFEGELVTLRGQLEGMKEPLGKATKKSQTSIELVIRLIKMMQEFKTKLPK